MSVFQLCQLRESADRSSKDGVWLPMWRGNTTTDNGHDNLIKDCHTRNALNPWNTCANVQLLLQNDTT